MTDLDYIKQEAAATTLSGAQMVKRYGADPDKWPVGHWRNLLDRAAQALAPPPPPPPPPPPSGVWWAGPQPPDTSIPPMPAGVTKVTSASDLKTLLASGGRGGQYLAAGFVYNGNLDIGNHAGVEVWFDPSVKLVGPAGSANPAVGVHGRGFKLYGGDVSNPNGGAGTSGGDGVKWYNGSSDSWLTDGLWWGLKIHDVASQGLSAQVGTSITGDVEADVSRWGLNTALDPHAEKGTGQHGAYIGGTGVTGGAATVKGRWIVYAHDGAVGAGVECGSSFQGELWASIVRLGWTKDYLAGNAFQPWGSNNKIVVKSLLVDGAQKAIFTESLTGGSVSVEFCRYRNVRLSPAVETNAHMTLGDWKAA